MTDSHSIIKTARYLFEIPISWFRKVDNWLANVHPGHMITFGDDPANNPTIGVDPDVFAAEVRAIAGEGVGTVTSVDGVSPDQNGNVQIYALTEDDLNTENGPLQYDPNGLTSSASGSGMQILTNVQWDASGHKLTLTKRSIKFSHGLVVAATTPTTETIDTATLVTWG